MDKRDNNKARLTMEKAKGCQFSPSELIQSLYLVALSTDFNTWPNAISIKQVEVETGKDKL